MIVMLATPWICRRCSRALPRASWTPLARSASTDVGALSASLLARARRLASEHARLKAELDTNFNPSIAKKAGELSRIAQSLKQWDSARASLVELQSLMTSDDRELRELALEDMENTEALLKTSNQNLSVALTPKHPFADMPCLIEIRPGPGGVEGRFFADTIFQMYRNYCAARRYRCRVVKREASDGAGSHTGADGEIALQEAVLEVQEAGAYGIFRGEAGMHRVQRVPVTEKNGRTHTSAVGVWVLPSFPETGVAGVEEADFDNPESDFYIDPSEVRSEAMRARGAGGQHVNKTESAIRLTHVPTGTTVSMQDHRSQQRNREEAWRLLRSRLAQQRREAREEMARQMKNSVLSQAQITRGDKIRTYNYGQNRCTDHRCGLDIYNLPDILAGGDSLDQVFASVQNMLIERDIQAVLAEEEAAAANKATRT